MPNYDILWPCWWELLYIFYGSSNQIGEPGTTWYHQNGSFSRLGTRPHLTRFEPEAYKTKQRCLENCGDGFCTNLSNIFQNSVSKTTVISGWCIDAGWFCGRFLAKTTVALGCENIQNPQLVECGGWKFGDFLLGEWFFNTRITRRTEITENGGEKTCPKWKLPIYCNYCMYIYIQYILYLYSIYYIYRCETGDGMSFGPPAGRKYLSF